MIKLDTNPVSLSYPTDLSGGLEHRRRLLVLVPLDWDFQQMIRRLWELASTSGAQVTLLGLCRDSTQEPALRRAMVMAASLLEEGQVSAEIRIEPGTSWVEAVRSHYQPGDMIVCITEPRSGPLQRPLSQILQSNLQTTVFILSGAVPRTPPRSRWFSQILAWAGTLGIVILAFLLQIRITSLPQDWAQTSLMIASMVGELWLVWVWNNVMG